VFDDFRVSAFGENSTGLVFDDFRVSAFGENSTG